MRYHIRKNDLQVAETNTRHQSIDVFRSWQRTCEPGQTVILIDTRTDMILDAYHHPTEEEMQKGHDMLCESVVKSWEAYRESVVEFAKKLVEELDTDPMYRLARVDDVMEKAAKYHAALAARTLRNEGKSWAGIAKFLNERALEMAKYVNMSTSQGSRMLLMAAYLNLAERLGSNASATL